MRSATLDTWLPEQVAFIQCKISDVSICWLEKYLIIFENSVQNYSFIVNVAMGNEKANSYWEAELPPNYDRVGIENFIRAKYVFLLRTIFITPHVWFCRKLIVFLLCCT